MCEVWHFSFLRKSPITPPSGKAHGLDYFLALLKALDMAHSLKSEDSVLPRHHLQPQIVIPKAPTQQPFDAAPKKSNGIEKSIDTATDLVARSYLSI